MKILIVILSLICSFSNHLFAQKYEKDYINLIHQHFGGQKEVTVKGGRIDILTDQYAIEIDFANKWKESIGQSLWYALQKTKKPGIVLILRDQSEYTYFLQLNSALSFGGLQGKIKVWLWPIDFNLDYQAQQKFGKSSTDTDNNINRAPNYWLTFSTNKRHNSECRYFEGSKGRFCHSYEGIPCGICGG